MSKQITITIIGVGSVGSIVLLIPAIMSRSLPFKLVLWDKDIVSPHNPTNQLYRFQDVGEADAPSYKVDALSEMLNYLSSSLEIQKVKAFADEESILSEITVVAVDSMKARKKIFQAARFNPYVALYIDARSGGNLAAVYALDPRNADDVKRYEKTLYSDADASAAPCADPSTVQTLFAIAEAIFTKIIIFRKERIAHFSMTLINNENLTTIVTST